MIANILPQYTWASVHNCGDINNHHKVWLVCLNKTDEKGGYRSLKCLPLLPMWQEIIDLLKYRSEKCFLREAVPHFSRITMEGYSPRVAPCIERILEDKLNPNLVEIVQMIHC